MMTESNWLASTNAKDGISVKEVGREILSSAMQEWNELYQQ